MTATTPENTLDQASVALWRDFERGKRAENPGNGFRGVYGYAVVSLWNHTGGTALDEVTRADIREWIIDLKGKRAPATAATYFAAVRSLYNWLDAEDMLTGGNPVTGLKQPREVSKISDVLPLESLRKLTAACKGKGYRDRRDMAVIRVLAECGPRASELARVAMEDVDMATDHLNIRNGKWARDRIVPMGAATAAAASAAFRTRPKSAPKDDSAPWLRGIRAPHAPLTRSGVADIVEARCVQAGIPVVGPHVLRHTAVSRFFEKGGTERDAMLIFGWTTEKMAHLYGKQASARVAARHFQQMGIGDEF